MLTVNELMGFETLVPCKAHYLLVVILFMYTNNYIGTIGGGWLIWREIACKPAARDNKNVIAFYHILGQCTVRCSIKDTVKS